MVGASAVQNAGAELDAGRPTARTAAASDALLPTPPISWDPYDLLTEIGATLFTWDLRTDRMAWGLNAATVLGLPSTRNVATGASFQRLLALECAERRRLELGLAHQTARERSETAAAPTQTGYRFQFRLRPEAGHPAREVWVEEHGRLLTDADGRLVEARGILQLMDQPVGDKQSPINADYDNLTGQLNRSRLIEALTAVINRSVNTRSQSAFLVAAINNLARINDQFGFEAGDATLACVGQSVRAQLRVGDCIGRYACNKFGIVLNDCSAGTMQLAAERIIQAVREATVLAESGSFVPSISIGGVWIPDQAQSTPLAISRALQALKSARTRQHDAFVAYETNMAMECARARNIETLEDVTTALDQDRMRLWLQPIVCSKTGEPAFYECLLRMLKPDGSLVGAGEFIQRAEQLGLSRLIDRRTLELAISLLEQNPDVTLSINVSSLTCADAEWLAALLQLTKGRWWLPRRLIVEITETTAIEDLDQTTAFVDTLRELGCRVAIDDFGAGYSSFRILKHLNADLVKIDGAFVRNLATDRSDRVFLRTMAELSAAFAMETVAEWVTDVHTANIVRELGITYMQGFHFGEPIPAGELQGEASSPSAAVDG